MRTTDLPLFRVHMPFPIPPTTVFHEFAGICVGDMVEDGPIQEITMTSMNRGNLFIVRIATRDYIRECHITPFEIIEISHGHIIFDMEMVPVSVPT